MQSCDSYSRGCQSCQEGRWLCIFLTYLCRADCPFCPAPFKGEDKIVSAFGSEPSGILCELNRTNINGISFSGGDPLMVFDRLADWLRFFKTRRPDIYYWVYTNGLEVDEEKLRRLTELGLNEIRFNIAATGYGSPDILGRIESAVRLIETVTVEIPSIPEDDEKVLAVLPRLDALNVKNLNLHEYMLYEGDPAAGRAEKTDALLNLRTRVTIDANSRANTARIREFCKRTGLSIRVNDCSIEKKNHQMLKRRMTMGGLYRRPYEQLTPDGLLLTVIDYPSRLKIEELRDLIDGERYLGRMEPYFIHPEASRGTESGYRHTRARLFFLPPLEQAGVRVLHRIEMLK